MRPFQELTHFAALDWAKDHHDVLVLDPHGAQCAKFRFDDNAEGWQSFREKIRACPALGVAIETSSGPVVERLLEAGCTVYPIQPLAAKNYRLRQAPSGSKDDQLDCRALAAALRLEGHGWRPLKPADPLTQELRLLCRDEVALIEQRTALVNQLQSALYEYYPAALEAFEDWTHSTAWDFIAQFPTPNKLRGAGKRKWENFLHAHKLARPETYEKRLAIFARAHQFCGPEAVTAAKSMLALTHVKMLRALEAQLDLYRERIQELYDKHPDKKWFGSLPVPQEGKTAPRLLAELGGDAERFPDAQALQCLAGTAPVRYQSGRVERAFIRRACNKHLRHAIHWFADLSRHKCSWAAHYYAQKIKQGMTHACALRCLGQRWLKIIWKMWTTRTPYDPELHQKNQIQHGSWVMKLLSPSPPQSPSPAP